MTQCKQRCVRCLEMSHRLTGCTEKLLATLAELESQLEHAQTAKADALKSLRDEETSSKLVQQRCRELEESCDQLKNEKDKRQQQIAQLESDAGRILFVNAIFKGYTFPILE